MSFVIEDAFLPATLTASPMTDRQFADFCAEHPDLSFETNVNGGIIVMPPNFSKTGARNLEICVQLGTWARKDGRGVANDSSTGYVLPNGARRSPDASWTRKDKIRQLPEASLEGYWHLCPDFVIELRSHSDRLPALREKMREYIGNGAQLVWLIDPDARMVEVFRPDCEREELASAESVAGEGLVDGFVLELGRVWDPLG